MSTVKLVAIALLSKKHLEQKKYVVNLEVVKKKNADYIIKMRQKEGFVVDPCLMKTERSPEKEIKIPKNGEVGIKFSISGALKPKVDLASVSYIHTIVVSNILCRMLLYYCDFPRYRYF